MASGQESLPLIHLSCLTLEPDDSRTRRGGARYLSTLTARPSPRGGQIACYPAAAPVETKKSMGPIGMGVGKEALGAKLQLRLAVPNDREDGGLSEAKRRVTESH